MKELTMNEMEQVNGGVVLGGDPFEGLSREEIHRIVNPTRHQTPPNRFLPR